MSNTINPEYWNALQVRGRYAGRSHMWLVRAMRDKGFPQPVRFGGRLRLWSVLEVIDWERRMIADETSKEKPAAKKPPARKSAA